MFFYNESETDSEVSLEQPVVSDPYFYNTSLLLKMDSDFSDSSTYNHSVTVNGNSTISSTQSKYGGASGEFDGSGDYLQIAHNNDLNLAGDWTVELWVYDRAAAGQNRIFLSKRVSTSSQYQFYIEGSNNELRFYNGSVYGFGTTVPQNQWVHLAFVGSSTNIKAYIDGTLAGTINATPKAGTNDLNIGRANHNGTEWFDGYLDDIRITKGVARYTSNFTPPDSHPTTGPESKVLHYDVSDTNSYPGTGNVLNDLIGSTDGNMTSVTYSTDGGGSLVFGAGSIVDIPSSLDVLSGDFTISSWYKNTGGSGFKVLFETEGYRTGANGLSLYLQGDYFNIYKLTNSSWTSMIQTSAGTAGLNVWKNVVLKRENSVISLYVDGTQIGGTYTTSQDFSDTNYNLGGGSSAYPFYGNIGDLALYDRAIADSEILQNYNATKSRFGL